MLPDDDRRRDHYSRQVAEYDRRAGVNGRRLAYLARRADLAAERDDAKAKAEASAERQARRTREATSLRVAGRYREAAIMADEASEYRSEAADWREAAARAQAELLALRPPVV